MQGRGWVGALVTLTLAVGLIGTAADSTGASASSKAVGVQAIHNADAEVFMKLSATPGQTASIGRRLQQSPLVRQYAYLDRAEAWRQFQLMFAGDPDVLAGTTADQLPTSFRVRLAHGARLSALDRAFRDLRGVDEVASSGFLATKGDRDAFADLKRSCVWRARNPSASDLEVFLELDVTRAQIAAVRSALAHSRLVRKLAFVSHAEALRTFRQMFAGHHKLLRSTTAAQLPVSFRIGLKDMQTRQQLEDELASLAGVDTFSDTNSIPVTAAGCRLLAQMTT